MCGIVSFSLSKVIHSKEGFSCTPTQKSQTHSLELFILFPPCLVKIFVLSLGGNVRENGTGRISGTIHFIKGDRY